MAMKKYLRLIVELVMGLLLAGALAFGYWSYTGKTHVMDELTDASEGMTEAQGEVEKLTKELEEAKEKLEAAEPAAQQMSAVKESFSNGIVLQDYEAFIKAQKGPVTSERQLGLGALRLLTKGAEDPETVSAFQKALEMAEWTSRLKSICAAKMLWLLQVKKSKCWRIARLRKKRATKKAAMRTGITRVRWAPKTGAMSFRLAAKGRSNRL